MSFLFFFFQAEDGIRVHCVTGVQTCALPISGARRRPPPSGPRRLRAGGSPVVPQSPWAGRSEERRVGKERVTRYEQRTREKKGKDGGDDEGRGGKCSAWTGGIS